jgi:hypothetical protein
MLRTCYTPQCRRTFATRQISAYFWSSVDVQRSPRQRAQLPLLLSHTGPGYGYTGAYLYNTKPYLLRVSKTEKALRDLKPHLLEAGSRDSLPGI